MIKQPDLDETIMINAHEESLLWELLSDFRKKHPKLSETVAQAKLKSRLSVLLKEQKVGMYSMELGKRIETPKDFPELNEEQAIAAIEDKQCWLVPNSASKVLIHLWAKDNEYFIQVSKS